ncbi:MAG TPA: twin-arginine translocase subunit TatC [Bacillota bacterium]|nr:twin-arginine translocase subunit TatC [Bacillota bacterium]
MIDNEMSWVDHLGELRKRIIWVLLFFVIALIIGFFFAQPVVEHLKKDPAAAQITWHVFGISDALRIYMQVAFIIAFAVTLPIILYQIWAFVKPGLSDHERRAIGAYLPFSVLLFLVGVAFAYYGIFPMIMKFMLGITESLGAQETYGMTQYFQFMFNLVLPIGLLFELPIIVMFLTTIRVINPFALARYRKYAIFVSVIIASMITPPDLFSHLMAAVPLIILYEASIWLSRMVYRKQKLRDDEIEAGEVEEEFATIEIEDDK